MAEELMTTADIHTFGIEIVCNYLKKDGHLIESVNTNLEVNPQIVAKKHNQLEFIVVRTACYPHKGTIENSSIALQCIAQADKFQATCYFASVGIANTNAQNAEDMAKPIRGAGFHVSFKGIELLICDQSNPRSTH